jgi:phospholipid N-methyltransferase
MFGGGVKTRALRSQQQQFFSNLLKKPLSVGAVAPSGRRLAALMVSDIGPGSRVIELGAGTGVFTQAILDAGVAPSDLIVVEQNEGFVELLKERFPDVTVIKANAISMRRHISGFGGPADFIVSGLPLLLFPARRKVRLLSEAFRALRPGGYFHQFTYGGLCPVSRSVLQLLGLEASFLRFTLFNLPPACVYRIQRR